MRPPFMDNLFRDLGFGLRQLAGRPFFTLVASVALGLGIGSVATQLSVMNGLFISGLPFPDASRIVHLERINQEHPNAVPEVPIPEFLEWRARQDAFEDLAGYYSGTANFTLGDKVVRYSGCFISGGAFELLRMQAAFGRTLEQADEAPSAPEVVVLSHHAWKRDFGMDPAIIGSPAILNGRRVSVAGIMPEGFHFPVKEDIWIPLFKQQVPGKKETLPIEVFGRLAPGTSLEKASASMSRIARELDDARPEKPAGYRSVRIRPFVQEHLNQDTYTMATVMLLITFLILAIACINVANLLLARAMRRQREFAIRSALGATSRRIASQFLTESILLSIAGAFLGMLLAAISIRDINNGLADLNSPFWMQFRLDWRVLGMVALVTIVTGIASGIVPALRASRIEENELLKEGRRSGGPQSLSRFSRGLVVVQISMAAVILSLVVLFVNSMNNAMSQDYQYDPDAFISARLALFEEVYPDAEARAAFLGSLLARLQARPEIESAASTSRYQFTGGQQVPYSIEASSPSRVEELPRVRFQRVSQDFFSTTALPLVSGRTFLPDDFSGSVPRVAIVNEAFARREWPEDSPLGKRFRPRLDPKDGDPSSVLEVVGICAGMNEKVLFNQDLDDGAAFFIPQFQTEVPTFITILARGPADPVSLLPVLRAEVAALDDNLPLYAVGTPRQLNELDTRELEIFSSIFRTFGIMAALLAATGIYGIITFSVNQRILEFGIRQALGATRLSVFGLVYRHALQQLGFGFLVALTFLSPLLLSRNVSERLGLLFYEIDHGSLLPYLSAFAFVAAISFLAATPPALRAARIPPASALRYD